MTSKIQLISKKNSSSKIWWEKNWMMSLWDRSPSNPSMQRIYPKKELHKHNSLRSRARLGKTRRIFMLISRMRLKFLLENSDGASCAVDRLTYTAKIHVTLYVHLNANRNTWIFLILSRHHRSKACLIFIILMKLEGTLLMLLSFLRAYVSCV